MEIGIVTCKDYPQLTEPEKPLLGLFSDRGINAKPIIWNDSSIDWQKFDCLILRSIWDYYLHVNEFFEWLAMLEKIQVPTFNSLSIINWNRHKFYLQELEEQGIKIIPSLFIKKTANFSLNELFGKGWKQAVIKPAISANAFLTESFTMNEVEGIETKFRSIAADRDLLVQRFMPEIQTTGEVSLMFFDKKYSHAVLKKAANGDFRVQADHGGSAQFFEPSQSMIDSAHRILSLIKENLLYARVDGVIQGGEFILMELELIEPELFLHLSEGAKERLVKAFINLKNPLTFTSKN